MKEVGKRNEATEAVFATEATAALPGSACRPHSQNVSCPTEGAPDAARRERLRWRSLFAGRVFKPK
jgi:hypothetical protein